MNTNILKKCLAELEKDSPSIPFVRGMLETLIEMQEPVTITHAQKYPGGPMEKLDIPVPLPKSEISQDEGTLLDLKAKAVIDKLKAESERMNQ